MEQNYAQWIRELKRYASGHKRLAKRVLIGSGFASAFFIGLSTMGQRVVWGYLEKPTYNPFKLLVYGTIWEGSFFPFILLWMVLFCGIFLLIAVRDIKAGRMDPERNFMRSDSDVYGSAHPMDETEKAEILHMDKVENIEGNILGVDIKTGLVLEINPDLPVEKKIGVHKFVCGSSGMRKSRAVVIPDIMQYIRRGESFCATDPKGELAEKTAQLAKDHGYVVRIFNTVEPMVSDSCNFLQQIGNNTFMAQTLANVLIANSNDSNLRSGDAFFEQGEKAFLAFGILLVSCSDIPVERKTLGNVYDRLVNAYMYSTKSPLEKLSNPPRVKDTQEVRERNLQNLVETVNNLPAGHPARSQWAIFMVARESVQDSFIGGFASRFSLMSDPVINQITAHNEIDLTLPGKQPCAYYVIVSDQDSTMNYFAACFFDLMISGLVRFADRQLERKCIVPVNLELDEFPNIGKIPNITKKANTIRSRDIRLTIIAQLLGQMMDNYPGHEWESLIDACDISILLGLNEVKTNGEWWERKTGIMTVDVDSERVERNKLQPIHMTIGYNENVGRGKRAVYTADEIDHMDRSHALLFISGYNVLKVKKFDYTQHPMYHEIREIKMIEHRPAWWKSVKDQKWFKEQKAEIEEQCRLLEEQRMKEDGKANPAEDTFWNKAQNAARQAAKDLIKNTEGRQEEPVDEPEDLFHDIQEEKDIKTPPAPEEVYQVDIESPDIDADDFWAAEDTMKKR